MMVPFSLSKVAFPSRTCPSGPLTSILVQQCWQGSALSYIQDKICFKHVGTEAPMV